MVYILQFPALIGGLFLGTSGITVAHGYSTADPLEAQVKQAMIRSADETYVLADSSKFGQAYLQSFASLSTIP